MASSRMRSRLRCRLSRRRRVGHEGTWKPGGEPFGMTGQRLRPELIPMEGHVILDRLSRGVEYHRNEATVSGRIVRQHVLTVARADDDAAPWRGFRIAPKGQADTAVILS